MTKVAREVGREKLGYWFGNHLFTVALLASTHGEKPTGANITMRACVHHRGKFRVEAIASVESLPLCAELVMPLLLEPHTDIYGTEQACHQAMFWAELP